MTERVYILLGSNLDDRERNLESALDKLELLNNTQIVNTSGVYESAAFEMEPGSPDFLNQVVEILTDYQPIELLDGLENIERELGRTDKGLYKSRTIDLDILLFGNKVIEEKRLTIPYKSLLNRPFAMIPLIEITPDIVHPVMGELIREFIDTDDFKTVRLLQEHAAG
jgi:2-amino-4-hydroxy-6-hydroxymethyldihydropteridine diphosphokinase